MKSYDEMSIDELMNEYSTLAKDPLVKAYNKCSDELFNRKHRDYNLGPEKRPYAFARGYEYIIELPYDELCISHDKAWVKHHDYSFSYKDPDGQECNACLSLCGYSQEDISKMIDLRIEKLETEVD